MTQARYGTFADVVIGTIATINGDDWTEAHEDAWEHVMGLVVDKMIEGGTDEQSTAA